MTIANATKQRYVQPHDGTKVETQELLMLKRLTTLLQQVTSISPWMLGRGG